MNFDSVLNFLIDCKAHEERLNEMTSKYSLAENRPIRKVILHVTPEGPKLRVLVDKVNVRNNLLPKDRLRHLLEKEGYTQVRVSKRRELFEAPIHIVTYGTNEHFSDRNDLKRIEKHVAALWQAHRKGLTAQRNGLRTQLERIPEKQGKGEREIKITFEKTN